MHCRFSGNASWLVVSMDEARAAFARSQRILPWPHCVMSVGPGVNAAWERAPNKSTRRSQRNRGLNGEDHEGSEVAIPPHPSDRLPRPKAEKRSTHW